MTACLLANAIVRFVVAMGWPWRANVDTFWNLLLNSGEWTKPLSDHNLPLLVVEAGQGGGGRSKSYY